MEAHEVHATKARAELRETKDVWDETQAHHATQHNPTADDEHEYVRMRREIRDEVAAKRPYSHMMAQKYDADSILKDIGPSLWISLNPAYTSSKELRTSTSHRAHAYDASEGWGERPDKTHHLKQDAFMAHADKCLQLGEKPFVSGSMKSK